MWIKDKEGSKETGQGESEKTRAGVFPWFPWLLTFVLFLVFVLASVAIHLFFSLITFPVRLIFYRKKIVKPQNSQPFDFWDLVPKLLVSAVVFINIWFPPKGNLNSSHEKSK